MSVRVCTHMSYIYVLRASPHASFGSQSSSAAAILSRAEDSQYYERWLASSIHNIMSGRLASSNHVVQVPEPSGGPLARGGLAFRARPLAARLARSRGVEQHVHRTHASSIHNNTNGGPASLIRSPAVRRAARTCTHAGARTEVGARGARRLPPAAMAVSDLRRHRRRHRVVRLAYGRTGTSKSDAHPARSPTARCGRIVNPQ